MAVPDLVNPEYGAWRLWLSWTAIVWERLWQALWPAAAVLGFFILAALLDILPLLASWLHGIVLLVTVAAFAWLFRQGIRGIELPAPLEARRRLERINDLLHRPLEAVEDTLSGEAANDESRALWREHQHRMRGMLKGLSVGLPAPHLAARDPLALRIVLAVALVAVGAVTLGDGWSRVGRAMIPQFAFLVPAPPPVLDAWITPPEYTGHPPIFLSATDGVGVTHGELVEVPAGSNLVVQVSGGSGEPSVMIGDLEQEVVRVEAHSYKGLFVLDDSGSLAVHQGRALLGSWQVTVIPDVPPTIEFSQEPTSTPRGVLQIEFSGADDYGLDSLTATIRRLDLPGSPDVIELELPLPSMSPRVASGMGFFDLTPHPWAGLEVSYQLVATDGIGQTSVSEVLTAMMPMRHFDHPVARAIIAQRSLLTRDPSANRQRAAEWPGYYRPSATPLWRRYGCFPGADFSTAPAQP